MTNDQRRRLLLFTTGRSGWVCEWVGVCVREWVGGWVGGCMANYLAAVGARFLPLKQCLWVGLREEVDVGADGHLEIPALVGRHVATLGWTVWGPLGVEGVQQREEATAVALERAQGRQTLHERILTWWINQQLYHTLLHHTPPHHHTTPQSLYRNRIFYRLPGVQK